MRGISASTSSRSGQKCLENLFRGEVAAEPVELERATGAQRHEGARAFLEPRIGHRHERGVGDHRDAVERGLDLDDRDVLAAADDHVLAAAADADVALGVHAREVAGVEPAVGVDR